MQTTAISITVYKRVTIGSKLTFDNHIKRMCEKGGQKPSGLSRISVFIDFHKKQVLFQSIIKLEVSYCPLIWMFYSRKPNNLINKIHEASLRINTNDKSNNFEDFLKSNIQITVHRRNLQVLRTEDFEISNSLSPPIMDNKLILREMTLNIRNFKKISDENKKKIEVPSRNYKIQNTFRIT